MSFGGKLVTCFTRRKNEFYLRNFQICMRVCRHSMTEMGKGVVKEGRGLHESWAKTEMGEDSLESYFRH